MESDDKGWIALHRKFVKWEWYTDGNTMRLFIHLLLSANHKKKKWKGVSVERGQVITGRKSLSKETGVSQQSVRTSLKRLKSTNELTIKSTSKYSIITICNYSSYQDKDIKANQQLTNKLTINQPASNQQVTTNNNDNNINNVNKEQEHAKNEIVFYEETKNICTVFIQSLENKNLHPKSLKEKIAWLDAIQKCKTIDGYSFEQILDVVEYFRNDSFWNTNFLSPLKLRKRNKERIKFIDFFWEKMSSGNDNGKSDEEIEARKHNRKVLKDLGRTDNQIKQLMGET